MTNIFVGPQTGGSTWINNTASTTNSWYIPIPASTMLPQLTATQAMVLYQAAMQQQVSAPPPAVRPGAPLEFNRYINASDCLERFIDYCRDQGVAKQHMLRLPLELFISWLIIEAARFDGEPEPEEAEKLPEQLLLFAPPEYEPS